MFVYDKFSVQHQLFPLMDVEAPETFPVEAFNAKHPLIVPLPQIGHEVYLLKDFIYIQAAGNAGGFSVSCPPHMSLFRELEKHGLVEWFISNYSENISHLTYKYILAKQKGVDLPKAPKKAFLDKELHINSTMVEHYKRDVIDASLKDPYCFSAPSFTSHNIEYPYPSISDKDIDIEVGVEKKADTEVSNELNKANYRIQWENIDAHYGFMLMSEETRTEAEFLKTMNILFDKFNEAFGINKEQFLIKFHEAINYHGVNSPITFANMLLEEYKAGKKNI